MFLNDLLKIEFNWKNKSRIVELLGTETQLRFALFLVKRALEYAPSEHIYYESIDVLQRTIDEDIGFDLLAQYEGSLRRHITYSTIDRSNRGLWDAALCILYAVDRSRDGEHICHAMTYLAEIHIYNESKLFLEQEEQIAHIRLLVREYIMRTQPEQWLLAASI
mgnify:CR=1 FL=1